MNVISLLDNVLPHCRGNPIMMHTHTLSESIHLSISDANRSSRKESPILCVAPTWREPANGSMGPVSGARQAIDQAQLSRSVSVEGGVDGCPAWPTHGPAVMNSRHCRFRKN